VNFIHPTAIVETKNIGTGNYIGPFCYIGPGVTVGNRNTFTSHVSVGHPAQHRATPQNTFWKESTQFVTIVDKNVFREFVTIHGGTEGNTTSVGCENFIMACAHIPHDATIEDFVTMSNGALIGGHTYVMSGATLSLGCEVHQRHVIGAYSIIGMGAVVPKGVPILPGRKYVGNPAKEIGVNSIGLERGGIDPWKLPELERRYWELRGLHV